MWAGEGGQPHSSPLEGRPLEQKEWARTGQTWAGFQEKPEGCSSQRTDKEPGSRGYMTHSRDREDLNAWLLLPL